MCTVSDEALASLPVSNSDVILEQIQDEIRQALPLNALMPSEKIELPTSGQVGCYLNNCLHWLHMSLHWLHNCIVFIVYSFFSNVYLVG